MWMSEPMPVMTRIITADSGSSRNARSTKKSPELIQVKRLTLISRPSGSMPASDQTCMTETANAASIIRQARPPDTFLVRRLPTLALTRKPRNGNRGISDSTRSPLQRRESFGVERLAVTEQANHQREPDRGLCGGDGHHEERDDLPVHRPELPAEGDE